MAAVFEQVKTIVKRMWECKQCHQSIPEEHTVAYHLIDGVLYGWCEGCFERRAEIQAAA